MMFNNTENSQPEQENPGPNSTWFQAAAFLFLGHGFRSLQNYLTQIDNKCEENSSCVATGSCEWLTTGKSPKWHMCEACRELKGHDSWSTTGQKVQSGLEVILQRVADAI